MSLKKGGWDLARPTSLRVYKLYHTPYVPNIIRIRLHGVLSNQLGPGGLFQDPTIRKIVDGSLFDGEIG